MKIPTLRVIGLTALFSILGTGMILPSAFAQDTSDRPAMQGGRMHGPMGGPRGDRGGPRQPNPENRIERLDTNGDGKVSAEEFAAPALARIDDMFERRDINKDGVITEGEGRPERGANARPGGGRQDRGSRMDRAGRRDRAEIDPAELEACVRRTIPDFNPPAGPDAGDIENRFDTVDSNGDGSLSLAEVTASVQQGADARFDKLDTDGDNFVTAAEIEAQQKDRQDVRSAMQACVRELAAG